MIGKVIDVTYHGGREQSEIRNEIESEVTSVSGKSTITEEDELVPEVVTAKTLKDFCLEVLKRTPKDNQKKRRVYAGLINIVDENELLKEENRKFKMEELQRQETSEDVIREIDDEEDN